jgi:predicted PurR-regulated permease PerM
VDSISEPSVQVVHVRGVSAIRRPLIVLVLCAVGAIGFMARDFLVPTAGAIILALMLVPVANTFERAQTPHRSHRPWHRLLSLPTACGAAT